jgi:hypothetical protein
VTLTPCSDLSPADWIATSELPWQRLVGFGPAGFAAYARLRFLPDPAFEGQSENDAEAGDRDDREQLRTLFEVLATHTRTPEDCYCCLWDGYGDPLSHRGPKVVVPERAYYLFRGPLDEAGAARDLPGPAFVWPADHAWCVAADVDPHWAGLGADALVIDQLVADPRLDVVPADPNRTQPAYR